MLLLPDPPLADERAGIVLRAWDEVDAAVLVAAWADPEIAADAVVPADPGIDHARAWIGGWRQRAEDGSALDLVIGTDDPAVVLGEVGVRRILAPDDRPGPAPSVLELGWWVLAPHRGRGVAAAAVALLAGWAHEGAGADKVIARIRSGHLASERVAAAAGLAPVGTLADGRRLWVRSRAVACP